MRNKFGLLLLSCLIWCTAYTQNLVNISPFSVPKSVTANTADWGTLPSLMVIANFSGQGGSIPIMLEESKVAFTIKSNGNKVCGGKMQDAGFSGRTRVYKASEISSMLGGCDLKPGNYQLCVQFFGSENGKNLVPISDEKCSSVEFVIENPKSPSGSTTSISYTMPQNLSPIDKKEFTEKEIIAPITFRWTPIVPKPQEPIIYRLKVWQLMEGQNAVAAMKANQPIIEKEVKDMTQAVVSNLYNGPCKPPYLCNWVWYVEAVSKDGIVMGSSVATMFSIIITDPSVGCFKLDTTQYKVVCKGYNAQGLPIYNISNLILINTGTNPGRTGLITTGASPYIIPSGFTVTGLLPTSVSSILPGNSIPISFDFSGVSGTSATFYVYATIPDPSGDVNVACDKRFKVEVDLPTCKCTTCDQIEFEVGEHTATINNNGTLGKLNDNNHLTLSQPIATSSTINVVQVKAELTDFYWYTENEDCKKCNSNSYYWGNLVRGTTDATNFNTGGTGGTDDDGVPLPNTHEMQFVNTNSAGSKFKGALALTISLPPQTQLSCCTDCFRFCMRYTIVFKENGVCKTCTKVKCYEVKRQHLPYKKGKNEVELSKCGDPIKTNGELGSPGSINDIKDLKQKNN